MERQDGGLKTADSGFLGHCKPTRATKGHCSASVRARLTMSKVRHAWGLLQLNLTRSRVGNKGLNEGLSDSSKDTHKETSGTVPTKRDSALCAGSNSRDGQWRPIFGVQCLDVKGWNIAVNVHLNS